MYVRVTEENNSAPAVMRFRLDEDGRVSLEQLQSGFAGAIGLKFLDEASGEWERLVVFFK